MRMNLTKRLGDLEAATARQSCRPYAFGDYGKTDDEVAAAYVAAGYARPSEPVSIIRWKDPQ